MSPIILWIDEIEKGFASAASQSTDGGLSKRMFGSLLTWMQEHKAPVFLVATANDIEALPPELSARGDSTKFSLSTCPVWKPAGEDWSIHLDKRQRNAEKFDLDTLAEMSDGFRRRKSSRR